MLEFTRRVRNSSFPYDVTTWLRVNIRFEVITVNFSIRVNLNFTTVRLLRISMTSFYYCYPDIKYIDIFRMRVPSF